MHHCVCSADKLRGGDEKLLPWWHPSIVARGTGAPELSAGHFIIIQSWANGLLRRDFYLECCAWIVFLIAGIWKLFGIIKELSIRLENLLVYSYIDFWLNKLTGKLSYSHLVCIIFPWQPIYYCLWYKLNLVIRNIR